MKWQGRSFNKRKNKSIRREVEAAMTSIQRQERYEKKAQNFKTEKMNRRMILTENMKRLQEDILSLLLKNFRNSYRRKRKVERYKKSFTVMTNHMMQLLKRKVMKKNKMPVYMISWQS